MQDFLDILKKCDLFTILTLGVFMWYIVHDMKKSLETKIDKLDIDFRFMNTRISRLEGTVYGKDVYKHTEEPGNTP